MEHRPLGRPRARRPPSNSYTIEEDSSNPAPPRSTGTAGKAGLATPGSQPCCGCVPGRGRPPERRDPVRAATNSSKAPPSTTMPVTTGGAPRSPTSAMTPGRRSRPPHLQVEIHCHHGLAAALPPTPAPARREDRLPLPHDRTPPILALSVVHHRTGDNHRAPCLTRLPYAKTSRRGAPLPPTTTTAGGGSQGLGGGGVLQAARVSPPKPPTLVTQEGKGNSV